MEPKSVENIERTSVGPWFSYIQRPIFPGEEDIASIVNQLKVGTSFFSKKGPRKVPLQEVSTAVTASEDKQDKIIVIDCIAKRRRNGERWEYKLTNESRREFLRKLSDLVS